MPRLRRGIQYPGTNLVTFALECPIHAGELSLEYPVGQFNLYGSISGSGTTPPITTESQRLYCPLGGGHTFNLEDCKATVYDSVGNIAASGVPVNGTIGVSGLAIGSILQA